RIQDVKPTKSLDYFISSVHWLDAITPPLETHLDYLADTVLKLIPSAAHGMPRPAPAVSNVATARTAPPSAVVKRGKSPWMWAGLVALAAILAGAGWWFFGRADNDPIVGCWKWSNNVTVEIRRDGSMTAVTFPGRWRLVDSVKSVYSFTWPEPVDNAMLSNGGRNLSGANQYGFTMSASRISAGPGIVGTWRCCNGAIINIRADGTMNAGPLAGHWRDAGGSNYQLTWPKPIDTVTLAPTPQQ